MSETNICDTKWHLVIIQDPHCLPGQSIFEMISVILGVLPLKFIILDYVFGGAPNGLIYSLQEIGVIRKLEDFLKIVKDVKKFDWGDFFMFKEYPSNWDRGDDELYPYVIKQADTTVRAVDDCYIYVYTPYEEVVAAIKSKYIVYSHTFDVLNNLSYPE